MHRLPVGKLVSAVAVIAIGSNDARAQVVVTTFHPVVPVTSFFAPTPTVAFAPTPVVQTVAMPVVHTVALPVVQTVASPVVVQPTAVPVVTYYRAPTVAYQPVARVSTRYRPILGGTVSRVRYGYAPVVIP